MRRLLVLGVTLALFAGAAPAHAGTGLKYVDRSGSVRAKSRGTVNAPCPSGSSVVGGGVTVAGGNTFTRVASSGPWDGPDADKTPDDGWQGSIANLTPDNRRMTTIAICATTGRYRYVRDSQPILANAAGEAQAECPAAAPILVGGGGITGGGAKTYHWKSSPNGAQTAWNVGAWNKSNKRIAHTAWTICAKSGTYAYYDNSATLTPQSYVQPVTVDCPPGSYVTSGGGLATGTMHSTEPTDNDADGRPDNTWTVRYGVSSTTGVVAYVVCKTP